MNPVLDDQVLVHSDIPRIQKRLHTQVSCFLGSNTWAIPDVKQTPLRQQRKYRTRTEDVMLHT